MSTRCVIVGGGFGGVKCAATLQKLLTSKVEIVLFNRENHMVFHPLLAEVASAAVQPKDVGAPLRQLLKGVQCRTEEVTNVNVETQEVLYESYDGTVRAMHYDQLVLVCGNTANFSLVPGMDEHAFPLKTIGDALMLQAHVMEQMEKAEVCDDVERKRWYLTFVVVGGGFSGVEVAGEINDLVRSSTKFFTNITKQDVKVIVVHSRDQLLPDVGEGLRVFARKKMEEAGVTVMTNIRAEMATPEGLRLAGGQFLPAGTIVCTIGTTTQALIDRLDLPKKNGRLLTDPDLSVPGKTNVWAFGDCALVVNQLDGKTCPTVAQFAERQGVQAAKNIAAKIIGRSTEPFKYKMMGQLCSIGGRSAVAEIAGMQFSGFIAWFMWRGIYLAKLPSLAQQIKVGVEWAFDLIFPRTLAHLKADRSRKLGRAHYAPGDIIFKKADPATEFFVIEKGEVEILRDNPTGTTDCVAVLGSGDFFGEASLLNSTTRSHTVKARSELRLTVLGRNIFTQISSSLTPVRDALLKAAKRRQGMWQNVPEVRELLESMSIETLMEPLPMDPVPITASVEQVIDTMQKTGADLACVVDSDGFLIGVITRSDLLRAIEIAALADPDVDLPVTEIMVTDPVCMSLSEPLSVALSSMRDHDLKQLPIVEGGRRRVPKGRIRVEKVVQFVLAEMMAKRERKTPVG